MVSSEDTLHNTQRQQRTLAVSFISTAVSFAVSQFFDHLQSEFSLADQSRCAAIQTRKLQSY